MDEDELSYIDMSEPDSAVSINILTDRPSVVEFVIDTATHERPEGELFRWVAKYLQEISLEQIDIEAVAPRYIVAQDGRRLFVVSIYTRVPLPWVDYSKDGS